MKVKVKVPATSANLGPGFDVAGLALTLYNTFTFELNEGGLNITGCPTQFCNEENLTYQAFSQAAQSCGLDFKGVNIHCESQVPYTRGLGSSSTCIVAGIVGAFAFKDKTDARQEILELATKIEGHPDNVAPAILGGIVVGTNIEDEFVAVKAPTPPYRLLAYVPPYNVVTAKARAVLPSQLPFSQAVHASAVANTLVAALFGQRYDVLGKLMEADEFHEQVRSTLVPELSRIRKLGHESGAVATYLSGAGPTIMTLLPATQVSEFKKRLQEAGLTASTLDLTIDQAGVRVVD